MSRLSTRSRGVTGFAPWVGSVRGILSGKTVFRGFDLVYAADFYDYLNDATATRLTALMFAMLNPGGRLLVPNFAPCLRDIGYMESFMRWDLIYRTEAQVAGLAAQIPPADIAASRTFWETHGNIVFLEVVRR